MAAQTFTHPAFYSGPVSATWFPGVIDRSVALDLDNLIGPDGTALTTIEANDVVKVFRLPPNIKVLFGRIDCEDLDAHATPTVTMELQVTDGTTTKYIFNDTTIGQTGGFVDSRDAGANSVLDAFDADTAIGYVIPDGETDWYLALKFSAAVATVSGDGIRVDIGYTFAVENSEFDRDFPTPNP